MSKHTPGPWIGQDENGKFNSDHDWSVDHETASSSESAPVWAGGKVIAFAVYSSDSFSLRSHPSVTANARLIAAAPELLEALRHCATEEGPEQQWLDRARTLIAKVDGELFNC
ncbi:MAG: hypothetical protein Q8K24_08965 [Hydrogenophaga sp.]|nr:hypothetical protein [Hydrogenophaga sp.]